MGLLSPRLPETGVGGQRPGFRDPDISGLDLYTFREATQKIKNITCIDIFFNKGKKTVLKTCLS